NAAIELPSRHLGLVQAAELADLDARLDAAAAALAETAELDLPAAVEFAAPAPLDYAPLLAGVRIGVARDAAFAFVYPANLDLLRALGAELVFFSPLADRQLPEVDSLYLPGGYPELHLAQLAENLSMLAAIRAHHAAGKPILAECGGMLYLLDGLTDLDGQRGALLGLLPGEAQMQPRLVSLAMQEIELDGERLRGHSYHHSTMACALEPIAQGECPNYRRTSEPLYRSGRLTASYIHFYLPSAPRAAAALLRP
ncbi:MAG TPA: cobyrinate a,c-diamide synthase, partial [Pseudomonas sp.]|nr:cobyrinate a,c-diamide synthase [Pseudomonas sp.]